MSYKYYFLIVLFCGISLCVSAQRDTLHYSELEKIIEKTIAKEKSIRPDLQSMWTLKTAPFSYASFNFPSFLLESEYVIKGKIGLQIGGGIINGSGYLANADTDQRGYRLNAAIRYYFQCRESGWNYYMNPRMDIFRATAEKEVLVWQEERSYLRLEQITAAIEATDYQMQFGWQYLAKKGFLLELNFGAGLRVASATTTADIDRGNTFFDGFINTNLPPNREHLLPILRSEIRVGWVFGRKAVKERK